MKSRVAEFGRLGWAGRLNTPLLHYSTPINDSHEIR